MTKKFLTFGILLIVLTGILLPGVVYGAECSPEQLAAGGETVNFGSVTGEGLGTGIAVVTYCKMPGESDSTLFNALDSMVQSLFKGIGQILFGISSLFLIISGKIFDYIVNFTIIDMSKNVGGSSSVGDSITSAWAALRDIANMCFIFVLLFAAFKNMFQYNINNFGATIKNIIIVALLINFSLFFSKVVIDASNIVSVGFYKSIVTANDATLSRPGNVKTTISGISGGYMKMLGLQTFYSTDILDEEIGAQRILILGIMSSIFMLITAVILLISGIMFAARFIILIFLMILSPLALIAYIIPGQEKQFNSWKDSLISQSFFAPLFFALTWVVFKIGSSLLTTIPENSTWTKIVTNPDKGAIALLLNYILIIGFSIAALVISKQMATSGATGSTFSTITGSMGMNRVAGVVGGATLGGAAALSRRTIGAGASRLAESRGLSSWAARSAFGQKVKEGIEKTGKSSFDVRQTKGIGGAMQKTPMGSFGTGKAGGYDATLQAQTARKEKVAAGLKTDADKQVYAQRTMANTGVLAPFTRWYKQGGSRAGHIQSLFGTMGRSNRIVSSRILNNQIQPLRGQLDALNNNLQNQQNRDTALNQQLNTAQGNLIALQNTPQANRPQNYQQQITNFQNNINNIQNQINQNQQLIQNTQNQINAVQPMVQNLQNQINNLGLTNTAQANPAPLTPQQQIANAAAQAAGQPLPHPPRGQRADEQNY